MKMPSKCFLNEYSCTSHSLVSPSGKLSLDDCLKPDDWFLVAVKYVEILLILELKDSLHEVISIFGQSQLPSDLLHNLLEFTSNLISFPNFLDEDCLLMLNVAPSLLEYVLGCLSAVF